MINGIVSQNRIAVQAVNGAIVVVTESRYSPVYDSALPTTDILGRVRGHEDIIQFMDYARNEVVVRSMKRISIPHTAYAMDGDSGDGPDAHTWEGLR